MTLSYDLLQLSFQDNLTIEKVKNLLDLPQKVVLFLVK
jgi:hypothetical protein